MSRQTELLQRLERQLHRGFGRGTACHATSAFQVYLWPDSASFYRNRALPVARPPCWRTALAELAELFAEAGRELRLEFFPERWPGLVAAVAAYGFVREIEAPVLLLDHPPRRRQPSGVRFLTAGDPPAIHESFLTQGQRAFELQPGVSTSELAQLRADLLDEASLIAVRVEGGTPVAGASLIGLGAEAELAGVWTVPERRRRGHATAVCQALVERFFGQGGELVWLSAAGAGSLPLYRKLGFTPLGTQITCALPREAMPAPA